MEGTRNLVQWSLSLIEKYKPRFWALENPRHTALQRQPYMLDLRTTHWAFCRYNRPYQKQTTLWHSRNLALDLLDCRCTQKHAVKLGGTYNGVHKWKRRNNKMRFPIEFCKAFGKQITRACSQKETQQPTEKWAEQRWRARRTAFEKALETHETPVCLHGVILPYDPDTGSDRTIMTEGTLNYVVKNAHTPIDVQKCADYSTELADGSKVWSNKRAYVDFELITQAGSTILKRVQCNVLPGPMCEILLGVTELQSLGVTPAKELVHRAIHKRVQACKAARFLPIVDLEEIDGRLQVPNPKKKRAAPIPAMRKITTEMNQTLAGMQRKDWDRRVGESTEGEPDTCLSALDDFHAHGKAAPSTGELDRAISDAIQRAADAGASRSFVKKLTSFLTVKYRDSFRLQLGADAPARVKPLKLKFDESSFPKNVHPRRYSPPQQRFLEKAVPEMERVGILKRSTTRFVAPPYLPV